VLLRWRAAGGGGITPIAVASAACFSGAAMSGPLIAFTGIIYLYVSLDQFRRGNPGMGIAYMGYAFSNVGLYLLAR
jgi:hypothetical protein